MMSSTPKLTKRTVSLGKCSVEFEFSPFSKLPAKPGRRTFSPAVELMGKRWRLVLFPGGVSEATRGDVGCLLQCLSAGRVRVSCRVGIVRQGPSSKDNESDLGMTADEVSLTFQRGNSLSDHSQSVQGALGWPSLVSRSTLMISNAAEFLVNDTLVVRLDIVSAAALRPYPVEPAAYDLLALRDDEGTTDLELHVVVPVKGKEDTVEKGIEGERDTVEDTDTHKDKADKEEGGNNNEEQQIFTGIKAHKLVLSAFSEVFKTMLFGTMREAQSNKLVIEDFSIQAVRCMVDFCYRGHLSFANDVPLSDVFEVLALSCKYQMKALTAKCVMYLTDMLSEENAFEILDVANRLSLAAFKDAVLDFIAHCPSSVTCGVDHLKTCDRELLVEAMLRAATVGKTLQDNSIESGRKRKFESEEVYQSDDEAEDSF